MKTFAALMTLLAVTPLATAGFIVEATGLANDHATATGPRFSGPSLAFGTSPGTSSWFGGDAVLPDVDTYVFSYTPGPDADNLVIPAGTVLGDTRTETPNTFFLDPQLGSGLVGGETGLYNVYITWPATGNPSRPEGSKITITHDGGATVLDPISMRPGESSVGGFGGSDAWLNIASGVSLTQGTLYTVTVEANFDGLVSQRTHGVLWEAVPEPATLTLLSLGLALLGRRAARASR